MKTEQEFNDYLVSKGFVKLGSGMFSNVYAHPKNKEIAIKVGSRDTWPEYVVWATENGHAGKEAPKVHSLKRFRKNGGYYIAVMERLVDTIKGSRDEYRNHNSDQYRNPFDMSFDDENPRMKAFMSEMRDAGYYGDLHDQNVMFRKNGDIVITDPSSNYSESNTRIRRGEVIHA